MTQLEAKLINALYDITRATIINFESEEAYKKAVNDIVFWVKLVEYIQAIAKNALIGTEISSDNHQ